MDGDLIFALCVLADLEHRECYGSDSRPSHLVVHHIFRRLRSAVRRAAQVESERNARRRAADGSPPLLRQSANAARDERVDLRSGTGVVARHTSDRQPVKRSKPRVGHGELNIVTGISNHNFKQERLLEFALKMCFFSEYFQKCRQDFRR
jgi:hypothetical protein